MDVQRVVGQAKPVANLRPRRRGLGPGDYQLAVESGDGEVFAEDVSRLAFTLPGVDEISVRCRRR